MARGRNYRSPVVAPQAESPPESAHTLPPARTFPTPAVLVWITLALLFAFSLATFRYPVVRVFYRYQINFNEGWNVYVTQAAMQHRASYSARRGNIHVGYPLLSFYLVGYASHFIGDYLLTGRLFSLAAFLLSCLLVGLIVKKLTGDWAPAAFASVFCLGLFCSRMPLYIGMDDPQMLAHPLFLLGLWLYLGGPPSTLRIAGVTSLFILGGNIKHNLIPAPISVFADLFTTSLGKAIRFLIFGVGLLALAIVVNMAVGGSSFIAQMTFRRPYSLVQLRNIFFTFYPALALPLAISAFWSIWQLHNRQARVISFYFFSSLLIGTALAGGLGVNANAFFDNLFAMSIIMGACLDSLWNAPFPSLGMGGRWRFLVPVLLYSTVVMEYIPRSVSMPNMVAELPVRQRLFEQEVSFLAAQPGPAMCESLILCYFAGKPYTVNPFDLGLQAKLGRENDKTLLRHIAEKRFGAIETDEPASQKGSDRFPDDVLDAIDRYYVEALKGPYCHIYVPRPQSSDQ